jgi:5-methylcytosine-specific restriction endonuclease McrA
MCRKNLNCIELGVDPTKWDRGSPLPPPKHFGRAHDVLLDVFALLEKREISGAIRALQTPLAEEIKVWYIEHGQMSGDHRFTGLGAVKEFDFYDELDSLKSVTSIEEEIYLRDELLCKYCSNQLFRPKDLARIELAVGKENFAVSAKSNEGRHGFVYTQRATVDHVLPHNRGGRTTSDNLVTSCWSCNYGKSGYTIAEIGLDDPR